MLIVRPSAFRRHLEPAKAAKAEERIGKCPVKREKHFRVFTNLPRNLQASARVSSLVSIRSRLAAPLRLSVDAARKPEAGAMLTHAECEESTPAGTYRPRAPEESLVYRVLQEHLETFLAQHDRGVPRFVERELRAVLKCGVLVREWRA